MRILASIYLFALAAAGCTSVNEGVGDCMCTMEFRTVQVPVVDAAGQPVPDLEVVVTNARTGETLDVAQDAAGMPAPGTYVVVTDNNVEDVSERGDELRFRATGGGRVAEGTFVVSRDSCSCHVNRLEGPERIVAR